MDKNYRTKVCSELTTEVAKAIKAGQFPSDQLSPACEEILVMLDTENKDEFMKLFSQFINKWPQFTSIFENVQKQQNASENVEQMFTRSTQPIYT